MGFGLVLNHLVEHHVQPRLGAETTDEVEQEVQTLRTYFQDRE